MVLKHLEFNFERAPLGHRFGKTLTMEYLTLIPIAKMAGNAIYTLIMIICASSLLRNNNFIFVRNSGDGDVIITTDKR